MEPEIFQVANDLSFRDGVLIAAAVAVFSLLGVIYLMARELVKKHEGDHWHCKIHQLVKPMNELVALQKETNKLITIQNGKAAKSIQIGTTTLKAVGKLLDRQFELASRKPGAGGE